MKGISAPHAHSIGHKEGDVSLLINCIAKLLGNMSVYEAQDSKV